jgi:inosine-uridine nucleoside N-ribohydrolase
MAGCSAVYGNVPMERAAENIRLLLHYAAIAVPVQHGAQTSLDGASVTADHVHGYDGLWGASQALSAPLATVDRHSNLADFISRTDTDISVLGIGPATNIAAALDSGLPERCQSLSVILMTGAFKVSGNITPLAEFNAFSDPKALDTLLQIGVRPILIGLDVCTKVVLAPKDLSFFDRYKASPLASVLKQALSGYMNYYWKASNTEGCFPHDAIALAAMCHPQLFSFDEAHVTVCAIPETRGATRLTPGTPNAIIATDLDGPAFRDLLFSCLDRALTRHRPE